VPGGEQTYRPSAAPTPLAAAPVSVLDRQPTKGSTRGR
jgi:hypothetical protein